MVTAETSAGLVSPLPVEDKKQVQEDAVGFNFSAVEHQAEVSIETQRRERLEALASAFRVFAKHDLGMGVVGHLTVRDPEHTDCFWVNPFHISFSCMTVSDLLLIDHSGTVIAGGNGRSKVYNQAAFAIHAVIHNARPDVVAVCHSHSPYGSAFSSFGELPDFITQDSLVYYEDIAVYQSFGGVVLAEEESLNIAKALGDKKAIILQNHGLLTVGQSIESAAFWFINLEKVCKMQLATDAASAGRHGRPVPIGHDEARFTAAATGTESSGRFHYQPYRQDIDRDTGGDYKL